MPSPNPRPPQDHRPGSKRFNGALVGLAVVLLVAVGFLTLRHYFGHGPAIPIEQTRPSVSGVGGPFEMIDQDGRAVTDASFRGKYMLVYFGYSFCPDVCPTSLSRNADALALIGRQADKIVPVFVSVDPERDTPERMKEYAAAFGPQFIGLTGTPEQVAAVAKAYRVYYAKSDQPNLPGGYAVDHSSLTYLMGPDGALVQVFRDQLTAEQLAEHLRKLVR